MTHQAAPKPADISQVEFLLAMSSEARSEDDLGRALELATRFFGMSFGIVSQVDGDSYVIESLHQPDGAGLTVGQRFDLGQTYCAITLEAQDVVSIDEMRGSVFSGHPCYGAFGLESYLGVPLVVEGQIYGTLNFSAAEPRGREWVETERQLVRLLARWVESTIVNARLNERLGTALTELDRANLALMNRVEDLDEFARIASHDLQAPLRKLIALSDLLEEDLGADVTPNAAQDLGLMQSCASDMLALIRDLLDFGRSGRAKIDREEVALDSCVGAALGNLEVQRAEAGADIVCGPLPNVVGQASLLTQVFQNLIGNGIKFQRPGVQPRIVVGGECRDGYVHVSVRDNGVGIDPQYANEVFTPFRRLHGASDYAGTGLGLAICRKIVDRHGGEIAVESGPDGGSRFWFTLPLAAAE